VGAFRDQAMPELTIAVIGCGRAGRIHLQTWAKLVGARVAVVCDKEGVAAARAAALAGGAFAFVDAADALAVGPFDIVDVCTPPDQQFAVAQAALQAGAHVICESPFTASAREAEALVALAAERERLLMPAFCHRFHPPALFARDLVDNDDIGRPTLFRCLFSDYRPGSSEEGTEAPPVGALMETAIHGVDLFRAFCGEVISVSGKILWAHPDSPVEDTVALALQSDRALGTVSASWNTPGGRNLVEIYGTAGACVLDYDAGTTRAFTADQPVWRQQEEGGSDCYERELAHFADAVRGLQPLEVTGEDGARAVALCEEVYRQNSC